MRTAASRHIAADLALSRAAGAPLIDGNAVRLLRDGAENYPAWLAAIARAERFIHLDSYIVHDDRTGALFAEALLERASAGVKVRIIHDWMGALGATPRSFWYRLADAGADVRAFNPPSLWRPLAWLSRDHRKMLAVDGQVAYVSGLCIGDAWVGSADVPAWRDTGLEILGPAVADVHEQFAELWATTGDPLPPEERPDRAALPRQGDVALRVVGTFPSAATMMRLDTLIAGLARERLWITDAYFVGVPGYVQALTAAAQDGVDVRLLVPGESDLPVVRSFSRTGYRGLLAGGVRVFEWNGPMLHAKTAVADGLWARIGSSDLNLQSWMGNWELDVAVEDAGLADAMERMFDADLTGATEVVLHPPAARRRFPGQAASGEPAPQAPAGPRRRRTGSGLAAASALRLGHTVGAALADKRPLGAAEAPILAAGGAGLLVLAALAAWWPALVVYPMAIAGALCGLSLWAGAWRASRAPRADRPAGDTIKSL